VDSEGVSASVAAIVTARLGLAPQKRWSVGIEHLLPDLIDLTGADDLDGAIRTLHDSALDAPVWRRILAAVTVGETRFLRQRSWFERIEHTALATLIQQRRLQGMKRLHIWSAGCSTGEETYTLGAILRETLLDAEDWRIDILGTDTRPDAIEAAERGVFDARQLREFAPWQVDRYFAPAEANHLAVTAHLRRNIRFRAANLMDQAANPHKIERFDLVLCRNVLMYMEPAAQRAVARHLVSVLAEDGWLAVSPAEALADWFKPLTPVNAGEAILFTRQAVPPVQPLVHRPSASAMPASPIGPALPPSAPIQPAPIVARTPEDPVAALRDARELADLGRLDEALGRCKAILIADRLSADAALLLAEICSDLGDDSAAHAAARGAVYVAPASAQAHFLLAGALLRLGKPDRAAKAMTTARSLAAASCSATS
jgi:chemotaxis protein methyltransferase CheR